MTPKEKADNILLQWCNNKLGCETTELIGYESLHKLITDVLKSYEKRLVNYKKCFKVNEKTIKELKYKLKKYT